jgi:hypothetical protein
VTHDERVMEHYTRLVANPDEFWSNRLRRGLATYGAFRDHCFDAAQALAVEEDEGDE